MRFHNLNINGVELLNSKQNLKIKTRKIYPLIKEHNEICLMLNCFNVFWCKLLIFVYSFYILSIWTHIYVSFVYQNLSLIQKIFMSLLVAEFIGIFTCITIVIFNVSLEVYNFNSTIITN